MVSMEIVFGLFGLSMFILPVFFLFDNDGEGVEDPAAAEMEARRQAEREQ